MVRKATASDAEQLGILNDKFNGKDETTVENIRESLLNNQQEIVIVDDENGVFNRLCLCPIKKVLLLR